eukprot:9955540-Ditylum_brightwellii.AAC.1
MEEIKYDISYASRKDLINFDNDAASCCDRIIPGLASLIGRKKGLHRNIVFVHATTLQEAKSGQYKLPLYGLSSVLHCLMNMKKKLMVNEFESETNDVEKLVSIMQQDAQLWSDLLWVSGELLELEKCSFHSMNF